MSIRPTPFHPVTSRECTSLLYKDWAGYHSVVSYDTCHEREYFALREAAGLIDVSPLYKYRVAGPQAVDLLDRVITRKIRGVKPGTVVYSAWCDERGKTLDDGTVACLAPGEYRVTSAHPNLRWFQDAGVGLEAEVEDVSKLLAALSVQGPRSRDVLDAATGGAVTTLGFFKHTRAEIAGKAVEITRTGYTGDLGYEVWVAAADAVPVYEAVLAAGQPFRAIPAGLQAMDVTRLEAGFVLLDVEYYSAREAMIPSQLVSPYEIGLGWTVHLDSKGPFIGRAALEREVREQSTPTKLMGIVCEWEGIEALFARFGLAPSVPSTPWRDGRPVYATSGRQVGRATSGTWSPLLKQNIALASIEAPLAEPGQKLMLEMTVEYERHRVPCRVVERPFFDPPRKRATPGAKPKKKRRPAAAAAE
ncbi:MAG: aminomethyltransferase family protein [Planctomycetota bacterium]